MGRYAREVGAALRVVMALLTLLGGGVPPKAALRAGHAPPRDGRPGSWSDRLCGADLDDLRH